MQGDLFCENFQSTKRNNISTALVSIPRFPRFSAHNFVIRRLRMYKYVSTNVGTMYILQKIHFLFSYHQFEWYQEWHNTFIFREHIFMSFDQIKTIQIVSFGHLECVDIKSSNCQPELIYWRLQANEDISYHLRSSWMRFVRWRWWIT